ncbi:CobW C-terminal domain-containing protein [Nesterenkonia flava]|uniref:GTP-binding protein n=1 Tax=Nesterenkonia flava TaxID=469799 RepID=A0ABU1FQG4_9MICC|nr:GTP-binding protein [Nesterenkonia flava]MDR5710893.1 GTP-binding protein [Nesterenkonia flava]
MGLNLRPVDVIAVVGACGPERHGYARRLAACQGRALLNAQQVASGSHAINDAVQRLAHHNYGTGQNAALVMEIPLHAVMTDLIGEYADPAGQTQLSEIVCVVDLAHLMQDLWGEDYVITDLQRQWSPDGGEASERAEFVSRAQLMMGQIEYASIVVMVNWRGLPDAEFDLIHALLGHLSPHAALRLEGEDDVSFTPSAKPYTQEQTRPGWVSVLNADFVPAVDHPSVSAVRYETPRPFHPGRLKDVLDTRVEGGEFGQVVRSAGFCRLATRPHVTAHWEQVGTMLSLLPLAFDHQISDPDELLAFGQDIVFIGVDLVPEALVQGLDDALLTDAELSAGPTTWATFCDPFPAWSLSPRSDGGSPGS